MIVTVHAETVGRGKEGLREEVRMWIEKRLDIGQDEAGTEAQSHSKL